MMSFPKIKRLIFKSWWLALLLLFIILLSGYLIFLNQQPVLKFFHKNPKNISIDQNEAFVGEIYDKIMANYWENISDQKLSELFGLAVEKLAGVQISNVLDSKSKDASSISQVSNQLQGKKPASKSEVLNAIKTATAGYDQNKKKEFIVNLASIVLANLQPFGRSGLYTEKLETQLKNTVNNVNPEKDLYKDLGLPKNASESAVEQAYKNIPEEKKKDKNIAYAYQTLTNQDSKQRYDENKVEPTIFPKLLTSDIAYMQFKKFSPTSLEEFQKGLNSLDINGGPTTLILDLRGNIGGAIDALPYFMGNFLGPNQYIFDFYLKDKFEPYRTVLAQLPVMKKLKTIIVLVDNQTQSSAELMASSLKRYHMGIVVGVPTKGWGTVERIFPLEHQIDPQEKYSVFLVHRITLRDDNQPIEGRGVEPNVNIKDLDWENQLESFVRYPQLVSAVKQILNQPQ